MKAACPCRATYLPVTRPDVVEVRAVNRYGKAFTMKGEGLLASAFCHEIDHLDGMSVPRWSIRNSREEQEGLTEGVESMRIVFMGTPEFAVPSLEALIGAGYEVVGVV